jgi:hypothetical protein
MKETKTDNHNLRAKLELRRTMLRDFPRAKSLSVCDCFSGETEAIWTQLRREFNVGEYLALDVKAKPNRLKLDSLRYLQNQIWQHDVIDLDAYGSPWRHWFEVLRREQSCLVFLTIGNTMFRNQQSEALAALGITFKIPIGLHAALAGIITEHVLAAALKKFTITRSLEALNSGGNARYIGVRLTALPRAPGANTGDFPKNVPAGAKPPRRPISRLNAKSAAQKTIQTPAPEIKAAHKSTPCDHQPVKTLKNGDFPA